jgi:hypothetical protein
MSVPAAVIECTSCDYQTTTLQTVGSFAWCDDLGNRATMTRQLGVCADCACIVAMETIPEKQELQAMLSSVPPKESESAKKGWFSRLFGEPKDDRPNWLKVVHGMRDKNPAEVLKALAEQNRLPICLVCGSTRVKPFDLPTHEELPETLDFVTNVEHPECGGKFIAYFPEGRRYAPFEYATLAHVSGEIVRRERYR